MGRLERSRPRKPTTGDLRSALKAAGRRGRTPVPPAEGAAEPFVFISYARLDRPVARALARFLEKRGILVWWDYKLSSGHKFREEILTQLKASRAVIVIWSAAAVASDFVLDEAERAKALKKLIPTHVPQFAPEDIPLGFGQRHTVPIDDRPAILDALAEHGIAAKDKPAVAGSHLAK